jgi:hypothetical protein
MSLFGGRGGRADDWPSPHVRAQSRAAERLALALAPDEEAWLDDHLDTCAACSAVADEYAAQRIQLRALRDRQPAPPRDLWARTAAAIEREGGGRGVAGAGGRRRRSRSFLAPYAALAGALVVAVVYGSLSSSGQPIDPAATAPRPTNEVALASVPASAGPTPLAVPPRDVAYLSSEGGAYRLNMARIDEVCPAEADSCATSEPNEVVDIGPLSSPATVFGSESRPLVVVADDGAASSVVVLTFTDDEPGPTAPSATIEPSPPPTPDPGESPLATPTASAGASADPTDEPSASPTAPTPSVDPTPTAEPGSIEIARGLSVVDTTAAYAPDGSAFAFTARPADGSHGPDIYVWHVGDTEALPVTSDHRSVFGSWANDTIVGSSVTTDGDAGLPQAFVIEDATGEPVIRPEVGLVWRPVVDPTGSAAVYWSGTLEPIDDAGWAPAEGSLVIGRWEAEDAPGEAAPTPLGGEQGEERGETTIVEGPLTDWDVRWDETGERLAVWIADPENPNVGRLSLYVVDPFDGRIDLTSPPLLDEPALAGFSMADGRLAWASPDEGEERSSRVLVLAWTADGFGQVESASGEFILVR